MTSSIVHSVYIIGGFLYKDADVKLIVRISYSTSSCPSRLTSVLSLQLKSPSSKSSRGARSVSSYRQPQLQDWEAVLTVDGTDMKEVWFKVCLRFFRVTLIQHIWILNIWLLNNIRTSRKYICVIIPSRNNVVLFLLSLFSSIQHFWKFYYFTINTCLIQFSSKTLLMLHLIINGTLKSNKLYVFSLKKKKIYIYINLNPLSQCPNV